MFNGCTALETAPELSAESLASHCYEGMFSGCRALTTAPTLPAGRLAEYCYQDMFRGCSKLSSVTMLAFDVSAEMYLLSWLYEAGTSVKEPQKPTLYLYPSVYYRDVYNQKFDEWSPKYQIFENWDVQPYSE